MSVTPHKHSDRRQRGEGHPILFGLPEAEYYGPFPDGGGYPKGFLSRAYARMGVRDPNRVLHVCAGSMKTGIRVDIREAMHPSVVADATRLPFRSDTFQWVLADPPYSQEYAENLYGTGASYPNPHTLAQECIRVLRPGGILGFMHHMVPKVKRPGVILKVYTITQGMGYNVRAWSLFSKYAS